MVHLDYRDARPIYAQLISGFQEQIKSGILRSGDKLPSVRELAGQLAINPNTIQRAYRELEQGGWIATVAGKGCFVCQVPQNTETSDQLAQLEKIVASLLSGGVTKQELIDRIHKGGNGNAGSL